MAVILTALKRLFPPSKRWVLVGQAEQVIQGIAVSLGRVKDFITAAQVESLPKTAVQLLNEWFVMYGLKKYPNQTVEEMQRRAYSEHTSIGGSSIDYLNGQIIKEFPAVIIQNEAYPEYDVVGQVFSVTDFQRLQGVIERIAPLHLESNFNVRILSNEVTAYTGAAITGRARCGRRL